MTRRNSMQVPERQTEVPKLLSEFIDNPDPGLRHFVLRWIPRAPGVKHEVIRDEIRQQIQERVTLSIGCPHCHGDVVFRYEPETMGDSLLRRLSDVLHEVRSFEFGLAVALLGRPSVLARLTDAVEELSQKLRGW